VLLQGETGTGKGLVARVLHDSGPRAQERFLDVNCAAIPETLLEAELFGVTAGAFTDAKRAKPGLFEAAAGGTLFLDEIDALPLALQSKLLTAIESKRVRRVGAVREQPVDVKVVTAMQATLNTRVAEARFRADLYHRLAVIVLVLPPLRDRGADIVLLAQQFLQQYAEAHRLPPKRLSRAAIEWLQRYDWPGNVRELSHLMERVTLLSLEACIDLQTLERLCLPRAPAATDGVVAPAEATDQPLDEPTRITQALLQTQGNVVQAARVLGLSRKALRYRMRRYGLERPHAAGQGEETAGRRDTAEVGVPAPAWEQKPVAVLAIEVTWPAAVEPDALHYEAWTAHARWEHTVLEKVQGFGGVILQRGPALLLVAFGLPHTLEQLPHRAVQTALGIRQMTTVEPAAGERAPRPMVRQAVHWGQVLADVGASDPTARVLPIAETLAEPVRLLGQAEPDVILVTTPVRRLVEGWFELQACSKPVPASAVVGLKPQRSPLALHGQRPLSRFVGRAREFALLEDLLGQVAEGHGQAVGIAGEPGVGKSRLLYEFHRQLGARVTPAPAASPVRYLEGHCLAYGSTIPYLPALDLLRSCCGIIPSDSPAAMTEKVRLGLQTAGLDPDEGEPYLLPLLGGHTETDRLAGLSPERRRARTFAMLRQLLLHSTTSQPLVLTVENLHWIDPTSEAFLAGLVEGIAGVHCLVLTTYRPGYRPPWIEKSYVTQMVLHPLTSQDSRRMLHALLQTATIPEPLVQLILARAQGNPFFLEEIVQTLVAYDIVTQGDAGEATGQSAYPAATQLPSTVEEVLAARLDRLPSAQKTLLQTLAVIGSTFPWRLLTQVAGQPEEALRQQLVALQVAEFLYEQPAGPELAYCFKHVLTQEVAYASLPRERRWQLHACTAQALEALYAERLEEHYGALAHHYSHSGNTAKAVTYLQLAGQQAAQRSAHVEAVTHLTRGIELLTTLPETSERTQHELTLQIALGTSLVAIKGWAAPDVAAAYTRARTLCQQLGETLQLFPVLWGLGIFYTVRAEHQAARELGDQLLSLTPRAQDPALLIGTLWVVGGNWFTLGKFAPAREHLAQGITLYDPQQHRHYAVLFGMDPGVFLRSKVSHALWHLGYPDQALSMSYEALTLAQELSHPFSLAVALDYTAMLHQFRREEHAARERAEAAIALCTEHEFAYYLAWATIIRGWALTTQGQGEEGLGQMCQGLADLRTTGGEIQRPYYLALLAEAHGKAGQAKTGLALLAQALAQAHNTGEHWWEAELYRLQGELLLRVPADKHTGAETCFHQALDIARCQSTKALELRAAISLSRLWQQQGKRAAARELLAEIYGWFTEGLDTVDLQKAKALLEALV
jgi:transcriptional regulator with AAA-type ATPase domain/predicted ATPase